MIHVSVLVLALAAMLAGSAPEPQPDTEPAVMTLFDFSHTDQVAAWRPIHDGVMGGLSSGGVSEGDGSARFTGVLSLENNGGFASFRLGARLPDLTEHDGLRLRVRGDGQVYKLSLRTDGAWDGVSWQVNFATTTDTWTTVDVPFEDLVPTWRGRLVDKAQAFDAARIRQLGLMIAEKQDGPYALEVSSIDASRRADPIRAGVRSRSAALAAAIDAGADVGRVTAALRWSERLLVVAAPADLDARASIQVGHLIARSGDLADRELRIVNLMGDAAGRIAGRTLSREHVRSLRAAWELPADEWIVALVGKDGGVKQRWSAIVEPDEVFALIDVMPMRQREVAERGTS